MGVGRKIKGVWVGEKEEKETPNITDVEIPGTSGSSHY